MDEYCENIDGTEVEERNSTIVWNYKNAEEEHGLAFAKELQDQIKNLIGTNAPVEIVHGYGFLEVKPVQLKKEKLLKYILKEMQEKAYSKIDYLLYVGSDTSDEPVFEYLKRKTKNIITKKSPYFRPDLKTNLCVLGKKPSYADHYIEESSLAILLNKMSI